MRRAVGLPPPGRGPVRVEVAGLASGERWTRRFTGGIFASRLRPVGFGFEETLGPLTFCFEPDLVRSGLVWRAIGWRIGGIGLPLRLAPRMRGRMYDRDGVYHFSVAVAHPWLGLVFAYAGRLGAAQANTARP